MIRWPLAKQKWSVPAALVSCGVVLCAWQLDEHLRYERAARAALIKRGCDITSILGVVLRSQRRFGLIVVKERIEPSLQALLQPEEVESAAILSSSGEPLASAGDPIDFKHEVLSTGGVHWDDKSLTLMNLVDLGSGATDGARGASTAIVMTDDERRSLRPRGAQRAPNQDGASGAEAPEGARAAQRPTLGRPSWMTAEQYDAIINANGVHSVVIRLSTGDMLRGIRHDLLLRLLVCLLAAGGSVASVLAWRTSTRTAELQIGLIKADEMNTHLKAMNFAAAGLAHETRNPLNLIRGLAQMVALQAQEPPTLKAYASQIVEEADRVTMQLDEFINYSKPREAHLAPVELKRLVAEVAQTLLPDLEEKGITLVQPETAGFIEADDPLLRQALFNVFLNATQAVGPGGRIEVRFAQVSPQEAVLEIGDDGPGVAAAERENIFKPYVTMRPGGVGLGLAIVRQIAAAQRWEVVCGANEPRGALFRFSRLRIATPYT
jgi:signal transduction histidine kinase